MHNNNKLCEACFILPGGTNYYLLLTCSTTYYLQQIFHRNRGASGRVDIEVEAAVNHLVNLFMKLLWFSNIPGTLDLVLVLLILHHNPW